MCQSDQREQVRDGHWALVCGWDGSRWSFKVLCFGWLPELKTAWLTFTRKLARLGYTDKLLCVCTYISYTVSFQLQRQKSIAGMLFLKTIWILCVGTS